MSESRKLNVFLCHSSGDKPKVRELYKRLLAEAWIAPWLDEEMLIPGMDWNFEIEKALRKAEVILFCLSAESVSKEGYVQKEIRRALDIADEKPEGTIYDIPLRLEACELPVRLSKKQWLDYYVDGAHDKLLKALKIRAEGLGIQVGFQPTPAPVSVPTSSAPLSPLASEPDLFSFVKINVLGQKPFLIGKYPVTNAQYARFLQADDFAKPQYWLGFPKFDENCKLIGNWGEAGLNWLREKLKDFEYFPPEMWKVEPEYWQDLDFGIAQPNNPVVGVNFYEANAYCNWLAAHWKELPESASLSAFSIAHPSLQFRLPLEIEWVAAAGGDKPDGRYPWDLPGKTTVGESEVSKRANVDGKVNHTMPVNLYPLGKSPHGVMDLGGNILELQANYCYGPMLELLALRGGFWCGDWNYARVSYRIEFPPDGELNHVGFRVGVIPG